jgi:hypothetical protein
MARLQPLFLEEGVYSAAEVREFARAVWPNGGFTGMTVSPSSGMTVSIAAGQAAVPTANGTGVAVCRLSAAENLTIAQAPASGSQRYDVICVQARGFDLDGGANNDWVWHVVQGAVAATAALPTIPAGSLPIANILVRGATASIIGSDIGVRRPGVLSVPGIEWSPSSTGATGNAGIPHRFYSTSAVGTPGSDGRFAIGLPAGWFVSVPLVFVAPGSAGGAYYVSVVHPPTLTSVTVEIRALSTGALVTAGSHRITVLAIGD